MSVGHDLEQIPCAHCHRSVVDVDALWSEGLAYHNHCYKLSLSNEIKQYQKKVDLGSITMTEANRMQELQGLLNIVRESDKKPHHLSKMRSKNILRSGNPVFMVSESDRKKFFAEQKQQIETNNILRESRWKKEAIDAYKTQQLEEENKPIFPVENRQKTDKIIDLKNTEIYPT